MVTIVHIISSYIKSDLFNEKIAAASEDKSHQFFL